MSRNINMENNMQEEYAMMNNESKNNNKEAEAMNNHIDYNEVVTIGYRDNGEPIRVTRGILRADGMEYILHRNAGKRRKKKASATKRSNNTNKNKEVNTTMNGETNNIKEAETMTKNTTNNNVGVEAMANENAINMDTKATVNAENNKETAIIVTRHFIVDGKSILYSTALTPLRHLLFADRALLSTKLCGQTEIFRFKLCVQ